MAKGSFSIPEQVSSINDSNIFKIYIFLANWLEFAYVTGGSLSADWFSIHLECMSQLPTKSHIFSITANVTMSAVQLYSCPK
jgi:hypothetical protein